MLHFCEVANLTKWHVTFVLQQGVGAPPLVCQSHGFVDLPALFYVLVHTVHMITIAGCTLLGLKKSSIMLIWSQTWTTRQPGAMEVHVWHNDVNFSLLYVWNLLYFVFWDMFSCLCMTCVHNAQACQWTEPFDVLWTDWERWSVCRRRLLRCFCVGLGCAAQTRRNVRNAKIRWCVDQFQLTRVRQIRPGIIEFHWAYWNADVPIAIYK